MQYVKPTEEQLATMQKFRDLYESLLNEIKQLPTDSKGNRGYSLAITNLEQSAMWLNKGITNNV